MSTFTDYYIDYSSIMGEKKILTGNTEHWDTTMTVLTVCFMFLGIINTLEDNIKQFMASSSVRKVDHGCLLNFSSLERKETHTQK